MGHYGGGGSLHTGPGLMWKNQEPRREVSVQPEVRPVPSSLSPVRLKGSRKRGVENGRVREQEILLGKPRERRREESIVTEGLPRVSI